MDNVPSFSEYQASLRESKIKGQQQQQQQPAPIKRKNAHKAENKENGEKVEKKPKNPKEEKKVAKKPKEEKKALHLARDIPFWQNDLFKPLVYVFAFVTLLSVLYLTLN